MGEQKKLEPDSEYNALDLDNDGVVSDNELAVVEALEKKEKMEAQKRMAWVAMISMIVFTALVFLPIFPDARIKALSDLFGLFAVSTAIFAFLMSRGLLTSSCCFVCFHAVFQSNGFDLQRNCLSELKCVLMRKWDAYFH